MANVNDNETQSTTSKLLTLANLARYNHSVCEKLGLTQDTLAYVKNAQATANPTTVAAALNDLYSKAAAAEKIKNTGVSEAGNLIQATVSVESSTGGTDGTYGTVTVTVDDTKLDAALDGKVSISAITGETGGNGITLAITEETLKPTLKVSPGVIEEDDDSVVTGGAVYEAIEAAKALDKYVSKTAASTEGLIDYNLSVTSDNTGGALSLSVEPKLTTSTGDATAIATDKFVEEQLNAAKIEYSFGTDEAEFSKDEDSEEYTVTIPLMKSVGGEAATGAGSITLTLDATAFVKDGFLASVAYGNESEGQDPNTLYFTWNTDAGETVTPINLSKYIDIYTADDKSIVITNDKKIKVNLKENGYLSLDTNNGIDVDTSKLEGYDANATNDDNNIATKKYVDDQVQAESITVDKEDVSAFGSQGWIDVKKNDTSIGKFEVSLPALTATASTEGANVQVTLEDGQLGVTTKEQEATDKTTYTKTNLAQAGYVDEEIAKAKEAQTYTAGNGIDTIATEGPTKNQISVKAGSYISVDENGVGVDTSKLEGYADTEVAEGDNNIATKKYVDDNKISVVDGANITEDTTAYKSENGIYVTSSNGTFTVGAVVATDNEIDAIFDGTHTA